MKERGAGQPAGHGAKPPTRMGKVAAKASARGTARPVAASHGQARIRGMAANRDPTAATMRRLRGTFGSDYKLDV